MYHQERREKAGEAAAAATQEGPSAATARQTLEQEASSTAAQSAAPQEGALIGSQQGTGSLGKIQQGFTKTTERIGKTLDRGRAAAASSAQFVRSAWSSSPEWNRNTAKPDWPEQPGQTDTASDIASAAASAAASQAQPAAESDTLTADVAAGGASVPVRTGPQGTVDVEAATSLTFALDGNPAHGKQLLSSFRLHGVTTPSILSTLRGPTPHDLGVLPHWAGAPPFVGSPYFTASGVVIPGAGIASLAGYTGRSASQYSPAEHGSDWDTPDISRGLGCHADPSQQGWQPGDTNDRLSSSRQLSEGLASDQPTPTAFSGRPGRGRMGVVNGREDTLVEPKYTPGVPPPPRGTLQISATAGVMFLAAYTKSALMP